MNDELPKSKNHRFGLTHPSLSVWVALSTLLLTLGLTNLYLRLPQPASIYSKIETIPPDQQVLGTSSYNYDTPRLFISGDKYGANGGMIALSSTAEPQVIVTSYNLNGPATVKTYRADQNLLLSYLTVNDKGMQINTPIDTTSLPLIGETTTTLSDTGNNQPILLPLDGTGIWLVTINSGPATAQAFVVRSNTGVVAKEGDNEFILWGQDFQSKRSINSGTAKIFNLEQSPQELSTASFNSQGLATTPLNQQADIALIERDGDQALVPLNLRYLNSSYNYNSYAPKTRQVKYFVFTDRPLYRPGDKIYFKAVLRDDDDARYTVPGGVAKVEVYSGYGEDKQVILSKEYPLSAHGTLSGEAVLPESAATGYYTVTVKVPESSVSDTWNDGGYTSFQVEQFRKPDYFITVDSKQDEYISGDPITFTLEGKYFLGEPLANVSVSYEVTASDYYSYTYYQDKPADLDTDYRYGYRYGSSIESGQTTLDQNGQGTITLPSHVENSKNQIYTIEVKALDVTGNGSEDVKNVLVYAASYDIYRDGYSSWSSLVGEEASLPLVAVSHDGQPATKQALTVTPTLKWWEKQPLKEGQKYPEYQEKSETLPESTLTTNKEGKAIFRFTPQKDGSYTLNVKGTDASGNSIATDFYLWVRPKDSPGYYGQGNPGISVSADRESYQPSDTAKITVSSPEADRDVLLTFERGRVNRYQVVSLNGQTLGVDIPLVETDMPNLYANVSSFSPHALDSAQVDLPVSAASKKLNIKITPDAKTYGPGETVTVNLLTVDSSGNPQSAEVAFWAVDKAIFELVEPNDLDIFDSFWHKRYPTTSMSHSLEGITALMAEGGGCFAAGTPVTLADFSEKPIESVRVGDRVLTKSELVGTKPTHGLVTGIHETWADGYLLVNNDLKVTPNHLLWLNGTWQTAGSLKLDDVLLNRQNEPIKVESLSWHRGKIKVYNLTVADHHTYYASGVLVHNQKGESRSVFKDTAYWNPSVITDSSGKAVVRFKLPDNLTTWTMAAVGATTNTVVGDTKADIIVTQDIVIRPVIPNVLQTGDTIMLSSLVHNFSDTDYTFDLSLTFDSGDIESASRSGVAIKAGSSEQVYWTVKPTKVNPQSLLIFSAKASEDPKAKDAVIQKIPVKAFGFTESSGQTALGPHTYSVSLAVDADPKQSSVSLNLSPTLLGTLPQAMAYLINYPYGCVEQTTSRFVPGVIALEQPALYKTALEDKDLPYILEKGIDRLSALQNSDGGWGWWSEGGSSPYITAYVSEYLVRAQKAGILVPNSMLENAKQFYSQTTYHDPTKNTQVLFEGDDLVAKKYALLFLDPTQKPTPVSGYADISLDLLPWAITVNLKTGETNPNNNGTAYLMRQAKQEGDAIYWEGGPEARFGSTDATTALALQALLSAGYDRTDRETLSQIVLYLNRSRQKQYWSNTFATAQVVQALTGYANTGSEINPNYTYQVTFNKKLLSSGKVTSATQTLKPIIIPTDSLASNPGSLVLEKEGEGQLYSTLVTQTFHTDPKSPAVSNTLTLSREYVSDRGPEYTLGVGDTVTVKLTLGGVLGTQRYAVIEDHLPSGMIPINPGFKNEKSNSNYFWQDGVSGFDLTLDGAVISLDSLSSNEHVYEYKARIVNAGTFLVPPATANLMYASEINARTGAESVTIGKEAVVDPMRIVKKGLNRGMLQNQTLQKWGLIILGLSILIGSSIVLVRRHRAKKKVEENTTPPESPFPPPPPPTIAPPPPSGTI